VRLTWYLIFLIPRNVFFKTLAKVIIAGGWVERVTPSRKINENYQGNGNLTLDSEYLIN
jgi:hypothetical protein